MIAPTSFFSDYGGHIRILEECLALRERGHHITIVTYYQGRAVADLDIRRTWPLPYHTDYEVGSSRHKVAFDLYLAAKAAQVRHQIKPDIIHAHMHEGALIGALLSKTTKTPLLFDFQGSLTAEMVDHRFLSPNGLPFKLLQRLERWIDHAPQLILTSSGRAHEQLRNRFGVPADKLFALPDCVDCGRFDRGRFSADEQAALRQRWELPTDRPIIAYLGLLADYQGTGHLLQAAHYLQAWGHRFHFLIMGYPHVSHYQEKARELGVSGCVTFTGKVPYNLAPLALSLGEVAVSAKMSQTEGSGKVLNYMAMGQAVVAYESAVHREFLGEAGLYAPHGEQEAFARRIAHLLENPDEARKRGEALRERALSTFSWQKSAEKIESLYQKLCPKTLPLSKTP